MQNPLPCPLRHFEFAILQHVTERYSSWADLCCKYYVYSFRCGKGWHGDHTISFCCYFEPANMLRMNCTAIGFSLFYWTFFYIVDVHIFMWPDPTKFSFGPLNERDRFRHLPSRISLAPWSFRNLLNLLWEGFILIRMILSVFPSYFWSVHTNGMWDRELRHGLSLIHISEPTRPY